MEAVVALKTDCLHVARIGEGKLGSLRDAWNTLAGDVPFRKFEWNDTWWRHYRQPNAELWTLAVHGDGGEVLGIAPWYLEDTRRHGRVVQFLGSGEVCSDYLSILTDPTMCHQVCHCLADWLAGEGASQWDLLDFSGVEVDDAAVNCLTQRLAEHGHRVDSQVEQSCWRAELGTDWNQYLATLSKSRRERTRALLRRAVDTGRALVHRVETRQQLERAFEILIELHQKRRQSLDQSGCFSSARFGRFHREVAVALLEQGALRMQWIELDGRPVAVEYSFVGGSTVYYYQGGFEPEVADERPGWLSFAVSLQAAIDEGYRSYDFLRGDEPYKASWGALQRPLVRTRVVGRQKVARVRFSTSRACEGAKDLARRFLSRVRRSS